MPGFGSGTAIGPTKVLGADGLSTTATLIGVDPSTDLAILQVNGPLLSPSTLPLDSSATLSPGDTITSVGYPNGQAQQATRSTTYSETDPRSSVMDLPADAPDNPNRAAIMAKGYSAPGDSGSAGIVNGKVAGILDMGSGDTPSDPDAVTMYTPASDAQALLNQYAANPLSLDYLNNILRVPVASTTAASDASTSATAASSAPAEATPPTAISVPAESAAPATPAESTASPVAVAPAEATAVTPAPAAVAPADVAATPARL